MPNRSTDMARILAILRDNREHAFLATCDGEQPDLRVMAPFVEDNLALWFVTMPNARKVGQLKRNPRLCLSFVDIPGYAREAKVFGEAVFVTDPEAKRHVWSLGTELSRYFPGGPDSPEFCVVRVSVARIEWRDGPGGERRMFVPPVAP
jgi:general stress protein 26